VWVTAHLHRRTQRCGVHGIQLQGLCNGADHTRSLWAKHAGQVVLHECHEAAQAVQMDAQGALVSRTRHARQGHNVAVTITEGEVEDEGRRTGEVEDEGRRAGEAAHSGGLRTTARHKGGKHKIQTCEA